MKGKRRKQRTTDAVRILHKRYIKGDSKRLKSLKIEREKANIAMQIYDLRTKAGLTQAELAKLIGTTQSVISRLENTDYNGYSMPILERIAEALDQRIEVRFTPAESNYAYA